MSVLIKNNIIFLSRTQSKLIAILFLGTVKDNEKKLQTVKQSLIFQVLFSFISSNAQDIITFHNGTTTEGKVKEVTDKSITFVYKNEDVVNLIGTVAVDNIKFESGRIQQVTPKITIKSPNDWKLVKVVYDKLEVMGLKSLGQIEKHSSETWSFSITGGHFLEKTLTKIRKEAAKKGGCIVLIQSSQSKSGGFFSAGHASMTGEIYTY